MSENSDDDYERVVFTEAYEGMPEKLEILIGDAGFIVPASHLFGGDTLLVQFDENKTGRAGGERHWIPVTALEPETEQ